MKRMSGLSSAFLFSLILLLSACSKDKDSSSPNTNGDLYIASPEKMMTLAGSLWSTAKPGLDDKKGYWYTDFTAANSPSPGNPFRAAVSLPAVEETDNSIGYIIEFNTSLGTETVGGVGLGTDTLTKLSYAQAKALMLEYYNRSLSFTGDTLSAGGSYTELGLQANTTITFNSTIAGVLDMLSRNVPEEAYSLSVTGKEGSFSLSMSKTPDGVNYYFVCLTY